MTTPGVEWHALLDQITKTLRGETGRNANPLDAYYYGFDPTGCLEVDRILAWVACAGKSYHSTEDWGDGGYPEKIQDAAQRATDRMAALEARIAAYDGLALRCKKMVDQLRTAAVEDDYSTYFELALAALAPDVPSGTEGT